MLAWVDAPYNCYYSAIGSWSIQGEPTLKAYHTKKRWHHQNCTQGSMWWICNTQAGCEMKGGFLKTWENCSWFSWYKFASVEVGLSSFLHLGPVFPAFSLFCKSEWLYLPQVNLFIYLWPTVLIRVRYNLSSSGLFM